MCQVLVIGFEVCSKHGDTVEAKKNEEEVQLLERKEEDEVLEL